MLLSDSTKTFYREMVSHGNTVRSPIKPWERKQDAESGLFKDIVLQDDFPFFFLSLTNDTGVYETFDVT